MNTQFLPWGTTLSAMLLVAGTCIGGGMLVLPVASGIGGFWPSLLLMTICWFAMTSTALLLLEVSLWLEEGAHVITMSKRMLGKWGEAVSWVVYLFICYASIIAYTAGGGLQISDAIEGLTGFVLSKPLSCFLFILLFGLVIDMGAAIVGRVNAILVIAMIISYLGIIGMGFKEVKAHFLQHRNWNNSILALPILLTSFSFQTMVPSLTPYLKRNAQALRWAVIGGTSITFVVYLIWQWLVMGTVPVHGPNSLVQALENGEPATRYLRGAVAGEWLPFFAEYFAFFALVTSFLGTGLGLVDFLSDGLSIKKNVRGRLLIGMLILIPTLFFAIFFDRVFFAALDLTGAYGDTILNGFIPILMVWVGRYHLKQASELRLPGGKPVLILLAIIFASSIVVEILANFGYLSSTHIHVTPI